MKAILITLLAFAGSLHAQDADGDEMGPHSYNGAMTRFHVAVFAARSALIADLNKSADAVDMDEDLFKKILDDEQKFNAAIWRLHNPEDMEPNPYETKHKHH
jgi:hypothetical protein